MLDIQARLNGTAKSPETDELTILLPHLNKAETLERCLAKADRFRFNNNIAGEVLVADNGRTDGSQAIAGCGRLQAPRMEIASEMVMKATLRGLRIAEVPTTLSPDGRSRPPHFLLLFSLSWLFVYPGALLFVLGALAVACLLPHARHMGDVTLDIHTLLYAALIVVVGVQSMQFWMSGKPCGIREGNVPPDARFTGLTRAVTLETRLIVGCLLLLAGLVLGVVARSAWGAAAFGNISPEATIRLVIPSGSAVLLAFQIAYGTFSLSVLEIRSNRPGSGHAVDIANG